MSILADNLARVQQKIAEAAHASGRSADAVTLVAVTKYVGQPEIDALVAAGCRDLGESRPQALWEKSSACQTDGVRWHLIGHLQRNKARRTLPLVTLTHSVDSLRLMETIDQTASELGIVAPVLLETNISGDPTKHGFAPNELEPILPELTKLAHVQVQGLMTMASREGGANVAQKNFSQLRNLRDRLAAVCPEGISLEELSMGMSGDYEMAIREGATLVRIGSALYEGIVR